MDSPVPDATSSAAGAGEGDDEDEDDTEALKAHIAKMKAGGDASAGNGEQLARSVKCSEVCVFLLLSSCSISLYPIRERLCLKCVGSAHDLAMGDSYDEPPIPIHQSSLER